MAESYLGHKRYLLRIRNMHSTKILVCGSFATGKSTLVGRVYRHFVKSGIEVARIPDVARQCPFPLNKAQTPEVSVWLIGEQIRQETEASLRGSRLLICDRGLPDILSHTLLLGYKNSTEKFYGELTLKIAQLWAQTYSVVFWSRIDHAHEIAADGLRDTERGYQERLQESLKKALNLLKIAPVTLPVNDKERVGLSFQDHKAEA